MCIIKEDTNETERPDKKIRKSRIPFLRHGSKHDVYVRGTDEEQIPRHKEINERLAQAILKKWNL